MEKLTFNIPPPIISPCSCLNSGDCQYCTPNFRKADEYIPEKQNYSKFYNKKL